MEASAPEHHLTGPVHQSIMHNRENWEEREKRLQDTRVLCDINPLSSSKDVKSSYRRYTGMM